MKEFNSYLNNLDYSHVKDLFARKGILRTYHKKDFFIRQNEIERFAGWVKHGTFQYTHIDEEGEEQWQNTSQRATPRPAGLAASPM